MLLLPFTVGLGAPQISTVMHALPPKILTDVVVQFVGAYVGRVGMPHRKASG